MAKYTIKKNGVFENIFNSYNEAEEYVMTNFDAKLINGLLHDKNLDKKNLEQIFKENGLDFFPLKYFLDNFGIYEHEVSNVHIENSQLIITKIDGNQNKIS